MAHLGLVGIGVMGREFALNLAENGHSVSLLDRTPAKAEAVVAAGAELPGDLFAFADVVDFVASLPVPRSVLVLVPSGGPLDSVVEMLSPVLTEGDLIADLGNSYYKETERRVSECEAKGLMFLGMGISGGAEGARHGPSIMAGGSQASWDRVKAPLQDTSAKFDGAPCCDWFGPGGAGHFIKMMHNGIEYADMQMIAEAYGMMRDGWRMSAAECGEVFAGWMDGPLNSYLVEIAAEVARAEDPETGAPMLDLISDKAGQKGTGLWTAMSSLEVGCPAPTIAQAVYARSISSFKELRVQASTTLSGPETLSLSSDEKQAYIKQLHDAIYCAKICAYAQGFQLMKLAAKEHGWTLNFANIAKIWRAGCIIRATFLQSITQAFDRNDELDNLLLDDFFAQQLSERQLNWRKAVCGATMFGIPNGALSSALTYYDSMRSETLPANLLQGQRDFFGAHTFERVDKADGKKYHVQWSTPERKTVVIGE